LATASRPDGRIGTIRIEEQEMEILSVLFFLNGAEE